MKALKSDYQLKDYEIERILFKVKSIIIEKNSLDVCAVTEGLSYTLFELSSQIRKEDNKCTREDILNKMDAIAAAINFITQVKHHSDSLDLLIGSLPLKD